MIKTIGIIGGKGKMGKLFTSFFKKQKFKVIIIDIDSKKPKEFINKCDLLIFSVPIHKTIQTIKENAPHAKKNCIITDLTSIKEKPVKAMKKYSPKNTTIIGLHPLFGPKIKSFKGKTIILTINKQNKKTEWIKKLFKKNELKIKIISEKKHDEIMSIIQGLTYFKLLQSMHAIKKTNFSEKKLQEYATLNYKKQNLNKKKIIKNKELIKDILFMNEFNEKIINELINSGKKLKEIIKQKNNKKFNEFLKECL